MSLPLASSSPLALTDLLFAGTPELAARVAAVAGAVSEDIHVHHIGSLDAVPSARQGACLLLEAPVPESLPNGLGPFIVLGPPDFRSAQSALRAGACDYLSLEEFHPATLEAALSRLVSAPFPHSHACGEEPYRLLFDACPEPMLVFDRETLQLLAVNQAAMEHYGYSRAEFLAMTMADIHPAEDVPALRQALDASGAERLEESRCWRHRSKDGKLLDVEMVSHAFLFAGRPARIALICDVTRQRRAERDLRDNEYSLRLALDVASTGLWDWDLRTARVTLSPECFPILGVAPDGFDGTAESFFALVHPEDRDRLRAQREKAIPGGGRYACEYRIRRPDGVVRWVTNLGRVLHDGQGQATRMVGTLNDISEGKQSEAERDRAMALMESFSKSAPMGFGFWDRDLRFLMINESLAEMNGFPVEAHIGRSIRELLPAFSDVAERLYRQVEETGQPIFDFELSGETPKAPGERRYWSETWFPVKTKDGTLLGAGALVLEITERKRAEEAARVARERLQMIVETCGVGVTFIDIGSGDVNVNAVVLEHAGLPADITFTPELYMTRVLEEDRERIRASFRAAMEHGIPFDHVYRTLDGQQRLRWIRTSGRCSPFPDGRPRYLFAVSMDITEQKRAEEVLRAANEDLSRFAYVAAHDLREPLRNIGATTELLAQVLHGHVVPEIAGRVEKLQDIICEGVHRMDRLLADLLEYTQAGEDRGEGAPVDLNAVLAKALANIRDAVVSTGAVIEYDPLPSVDGCEPELVSVFQNLVGNAIKYRSDHPPHITIKTQPGVGEWIVSVKDNGVGIAPEFTRHIFGMFKRLHGRDIPGTGIGLAICEKVVTRHGGRIWVESEPGKGSIFLFTWPLRPRNVGRSREDYPKHEAHHGHRRQ